MTCLVDIEKRIFGYVETSPISSGSWKAEVLSVADQMTDDDVEIFRQIVEEMRCKAIDSSLTPLLYG